MKKITSYKGSLNGVKGVWCGFKPEGVEIEEEVTVYSADEGMVLVKDGVEYDSVVLGVGEKIKDYKEVEKPKEEENGNMG